MPMSSSSAVESEGFNTWIVFKGDQSTDRLKKGSLREIRIVIEQAKTGVVEGTEKLAHMPYFERCLSQTISRYSANKKLSRYKSPLTQKLLGYNIKAYGIWGQMVTRITVVILS